MSPSHWLAGVDVDGDLVDGQPRGDVQVRVVEHPLHRGTVGVGGRSRTWEDFLAARVS